MTGRNCRCANPFAENANKAPWNSSVAAAQACGQARPVHTRSFQPSPRASNVLIAIGFAALGYALYMRYLVIENSAVGLACDTGLGTSQCMLRQAVIFMFRNQVFGIIAITAAVYHLLRPDINAFAIGLAAAALGLVLYNNGLAALSVALLVVSFARPVVVDMSPPGSTEGPRTNRPANSTGFR